MGKTILVVDDHEETRRLVVQILSQHGYEVVTARSGPEGLRLAEKQAPDLILLDVMMPEMDGYEVCRRLRLMPGLVRTPIIMFTAKGMVDEKWTGFSAGADDYLIKPTRPDEMVHRIQTMLTARSNRQPASESDLAEMMGPPAGGPVFTRGLPVEQTAVTERLIAVIGARGGAGATTAAINLAASIAQSGRSTVLVDFDAGQGHAAVYLNRAQAPGLTGLIRQAAGDLVNSLPAFLVDVGDNLQLLPVQADRERPFPPLDEGQTLDLIDGLLFPDRCVVVDLGRLLSPMALAVLGRADEVLVCLRAERVAMSSARQLLRQLPEYLAPEARLHPLMLDFGLGRNLPPELIESFLGQPPLASISIPSQQMTQAVNQGEILVHGSENAAVRQQFAALARELVRQLH